MSEQQRQQPKKGHPKTTAKAKNPKVAKNHEFRVAIKALEVFGAVALFLASILAFSPHKNIALAIFFIAASSGVLVIYLTWRPSLKTAPKRRRNIVGWVFIGIEALLICICIIMQQLLISPPLRGMLLAANDPEPTNPPCSKTSPRIMAFYFGNVEATSTNLAVTVLRLDGEDMLSFQRTAANGVYLNAIIRDTAHNEIGKITNNVFRATSQNGYYAEHPDQSTLVIIGPRDEKILYARYMNPSSFKIIGTFWSKRTNTTVTLGDLFDLGGRMKFVGPYCFEARKADVIFDVH